MIFEEQFPVPRYTGASKIGNSVISLLWQLRRRCNPDHNKFSSSSNTTVVAISPKLCLWRRTLRSNLGGIDPEKLYRATLRYDAISKSRNPEVLCKYELLNFKVLKIESNTTSDYIECLIYHLEHLKRLGAIRSQILQNVMVISIRYSNLVHNGNFLSFLFTNSWRN